MIATAGHALVLVVQVGTVVALVVAALFAALVTPVVEPGSLWHEPDLEPGSVSPDPVESVAVEPDAVWTLQT